jgi:tRNA threonylcarbamoyl adenosine modification protein YeaZ
MKILAIEFSSEQRGVAVIDSGAISARRDSALGSSAGLQPIVLGKAVEFGGRRALGLVEQALGQAGAEREEIECIAVGLGPGSYTGIRGAIALAQGWQLGREVKLLGISSIVCIAAQVQGEKIFGPVNIIVDAQRKEFYLACYRIDPSGQTETQPLHITSSESVQTLIARGETVVGPEAAKWFPGAKDIYPDCAILGCLAAARSDFVRGPDLQPIYLRETSFKKAPPPRSIA